MKEASPEVDVLLGDYECFEEKESIEYVQQFQPKINFLTAQNYVDFDDIDEPFKQQIEIIFAEDISLQLSRSHEIQVTLAQNKLEVADNPFDPYATI